MDRYRLKNIIILILVLANVSLLGSLAIRDQAEHNARRRTSEQLVALFAADGIALDPDIISTEVPPASRSLTRDTSLDQEAASFLLGSILSSSDKGGGIYDYTSAVGTATFRSNGTFDVASLQGPLAESGALDFCRDFCRRFSYSEPVFQLDEDGTGKATATPLCDKLPVFNCTVDFTFSEGALIAVSGTLLPDSYAALSSEIPPLSASAALTTFQEETFAVISAVTDIYLCYELQSPTPSSITLTPSWCIVTDTAKYYVNCKAGTITTN